MSGMRCTREKCPIKELTDGASICTAHDCSYRTEPMTNANCIRAMSDEKLATLLCSTGWRMGEEADCLAWLQQTAKEGVG